MIYQRPLESMGTDGVKALEGMIPEDKRRLSETRKLGLVTARSRGHGNGRS